MLVFTIDLLGNTWEHHIVGAVQFVSCSDIFWFQYSETAVWITPFWGWKLMILRHSHVIVQESETDQLSLILGMYRNIMINNSSTIRSRAKQHRTQYMFDPIGTLYSQHFHFLWFLHVMDISGKKHNTQPEGKAQSTETNLTPWIPAMCPPSQL